MTIATVQIDFEITDTDFVDILETAAMCIGYWADDCEIAEPYDSTDSETEMALTCEEGTQLYTLRKFDIQDAMGSIANGLITIDPSIKGDILSAIKNDDYGYIDGYAADAIIQVACFGEVIYG